MTDAETIAHLRSEAQDEVRLAALALEVGNQPSADWHEMRARSLRDRADRLERETADAERQREEEEADARGRAEIDLHARRFDAQEASMDCE